MDLNSVNIKNKRASFDYEFIEREVVGIVLTGTEIKSIRHGKASIAESYCTIENGQLWILNMDVSIYVQGSYNNHEPKRKRKLLMAKKDILKWEAKLKTRGLTIVPIKLFLSEKGWAKLDIALAKGKQTFDKRNSIKEKDLKMEMKRSETYK
jgi:SsrA-binding protein